MGAWLSTEVGLGILRSILLSSGVTAVVAGYFTGTQWADIVGAIISIATIVISAMSNRTKAQNKAIVQAVEAHPSITVTQAAVSPTGKPLVRVAPEPSISTQLGH